MEIQSAITPTTGGWKGLSKPVKGLIIVGGLALLGFGIWYFTRKKEDNAPSPTPTPPTPDDNVKADASPLAPLNNALSTPSKEIKLDTTLPNGGKNCSQVITNFDRDYNYVKCDGAWYTKSKKDAVSVTARTKYIDWFSLANNKVASDRLNARYQ